VKGSATLAIVAAPRMGPGVEEFVRICVGFVAGGGGLTLLEVGPARGLLSSGRNLPDEVERGLEGLAAFGIAAGPATAEELVDLLRGCERVVRVAAPDRRGTPPVSWIDDAYLEEVDAQELLRDLVDAGQVIRARQP